MNKCNKLIATRKEILLLLFFVLAMCLSIYFNQKFLGCCFLLIVIFILSKKGSVKKINIKKLEIDFYSIPQAKLIIQSSQWIKQNLDLKKVTPSQVDLYLNLKLSKTLRLTSPFNYFRKIDVNTLNDYYKYWQKGYYGFTTPEIALESQYMILLNLFYLLRNAQRAPLKKYEVKKVIFSLPAIILHFLGDKESEVDYKDKNIEEFLSVKDSNVKSNKKGCEIKIKVCDEYSDYYYFTELLRADFTGSECEEILFLQYFHVAGGTFNIYTPLLVRRIEERYDLISMPDVIEEPYFRKFITFLSTFQYTRCAFIYKFISRFVKSNKTKDEILENK
ncbi:MAG: hypothetical protein R3Y43_06780 [Alphaproteobacteria bacterium]